MANSYTSGLAQASSPEAPCPHPVWDKCLLIWCPQKSISVFSFTSVSPASLELFNKKQNVSLKYQR
jgi:hypothetical protein